MPRHSSRRPRRIAPSILAGAAAILGLGLFLLNAGSATVAHGATVNLVPTSEPGTQNFWVSNTGGDKVQAVNEGNCSPGDADWITGNNATSDSFEIRYPFEPYSAISSIQLFVCYGDDNSSDDFQALTVDAHTDAYTDTFSLNAKGNMTPTTYSKTWTFSGRQSYHSSLRFTLTDHGFLASSRTRVYAMWAVVTYEPPPPPTITIQDAGSPPYSVGQPLAFNLDVTLFSSSRQLDLVTTWDPKVLLLTSPVFSPTFGGCPGYLGKLTCTITMYTGGTFLSTIRMQVLSADACEASLSASLIDHVSGATVASSSDTVSLNGGCSTPTATPTDTATPTATSTPPSSTSTTTTSPTSPTAPTTTTSTTATATNSTTATGTATTPTPTPSPSPTPTPAGGSLHNKLRAAFLARDGG